MSEEDPKKTSTTPETIPYSRFAEVVGEKNELAAKLKEADARAKAAEERAATADTLAKQVEESRTNHKKEKAEWDMERAFVDAGIHDQEGRDVARFHYNRLPEQGRPPVADWLTTLREDATKAPKSLAPFLGEGTATAGKEPPKTGTTSTGTKAPPKTTKAADANSAGAAHGEPASADKIREARIAAQKSGDWTEFRRFAGLPEEKKDTEVVTAPGAGR